MKLIKPTIISIVLFFVSTLLSGQSAYDSTLYYKIDVQSTADTTRFNISLHCKVNADTAIQIRLPQDYYGIQQLYRYVTKFETLKGSRADTSVNDPFRLIYPNEDREINIQYQLTFDKRSLEDYTYGPNFSKDNFQLFFCQWMLMVGKSNEMFYYDIQLNTPTSVWTKYTSVQSNPDHIRVYTSYNNQISSILGASRLPVYSFLINGKPLYVIVASEFNVLSKVIANTAFKIVEAQRNWLGDFDFPFFYISVNKRENNIAGTCINNMFTCFIDEKTDKDKLAWLFSHEMFHVWVGNKFYITTKQSLPINPFQWFHEGVNEYCARLILKEILQISTKDFVRFFNKDIVDIADNKFKAYSLSQIAQLAEAGKFNQEANKLAYYRGALLALRWQYQMEVSGTGKNMKEFIKYLFQEAKKSGAAMDQETFFTAGQLFGLDIKSDYEKYIVNGQPIDLPAGVFGEEYKLKEAKVPSFVSGFRVSNGVIDSVDISHNAYKAGLRPGMKFVGSLNGNRFGNIWDPFKPLTVIIKQNGVDKKISYKPTGKLHRLLQYIKD
jgi:predicted metalloprotease with PDZ domain